MNFPLGVTRDVYFSLSGFFIHQPMDFDAIKAELEAASGQSFSIDGGGYSLIPILAGFRYYASNSSSVGVYFAGQAGMNIVTLGDVNLQSGGSTVNESFSTGTSFAFAAGAGLVLNERFEVGIRYMGLGKPEFDMDVKRPSGSFTGSVKQDISLISLLAGIKF